MIRPPSGNHSAGVEITPMIDMVFLLLIFFLVATTFHQTEREMQIALPEASASTPITAALREIVVNIDAGGAIIVAGRTITPDALRELVAGAIGANPEQKVTVRGDRAASYEHVVRALDACKAGGVQAPYLDTLIAR